MRNNATLYERHPVLDVLFSRKKMNVLTLMVIIILSYWIIAMWLVSKRKNWD